MMRRLAVLLGAVLLVPLAAACSGSSSSPDPSPAVLPGPTGGVGLVGPQWTLVAAAVDSVDLSAFGMTATFTDADVSGHAGVNRYAGPYSSSPDGAMDVGTIATTRMAGPDDAMRAERAYLATLARVTGYGVTSTRLVLFADAQEVLVFAR